jgi:hypothetical protein
MSETRMVILLPDQIQYVRSLCQSEFEDDIEFEKDTGYVTWYNCDNRILPRSAFWDALSFLDQEGEISIDYNCIEAESSFLSVWVTRD